MPEVETICRSLRRYLPQRTIDRVDILSVAPIKWPTAEEFARRTTGKTIADVTRRGKYILLNLAPEGTLVIHLRMTGSLVYRETQIPPSGHDRIVFRLSGGATLTYADTRCLGTLQNLLPGEENQAKGLYALGPEPLSAEFTVPFLTHKCAGKRGKIKSTLLDQSFVAGLGNIYVDEALFVAGIHPLRSPASLTAAEISRLHAAVNEVIAAGIKDGGTTFRDYKNAEGGRGTHQEHLYVYGRTGQPCRKCGTPIERIVVGGRGTHFCPHCQIESEKLLSAQEICL